jgi:gamma-glutamylcyclotransferase (GGCT)/AIG2-like uncharacterized protein YtfP
MNRLIKKQSLFEQINGPAIHYLAYGMNTNNENMQEMCPEAENLGKVEIHDWALEFNRHANVTKKIGSKIYCVLWILRADNERRLDRLEGYPLYYNKTKIDVHMSDNSITSAMIYVMTSDSRKLSLGDAPDTYYVDLIVQGYNANKIPLTQMYNAAGYPLGNKRYPQPK